MVDNNPASKKPLQLKIEDRTS